MKNMKGGGGRITKGYITSRRKNCTSIKEGGSRFHYSKKSPSQKKKKGAHSRKAEREEETKKPIKEKKPLELPENQPVLT